MSNPAVATCSEHSAVCSDSHGQQDNRHQDDRQQSETYNMQMQPRSPPGPHDMGRPLSKKLPCVDWYFYEFRNELCCGYRITWSTQLDCWTQVGHSSATFSCVHHLTHISLRDYVLRDYHLTISVLDHHMTNTFQKTHLFSHSWPSLDQHTFFVSSLTITWPTSLFWTLICALDHHLPNKFKNHALTNPQQIPQKCILLEGKSNSARKAETSEQNTLDSVHSPF